MITGLHPRNDDDRLQRMHETYVGKVNASVAAGRNGLAQELAEAYRRESAGAGAAEVRGVPRRQVRWTRLVLDPLRRFDRYTLEDFNPGAPYRPRTDRPAR